MSINYHIDQKVVCISEFPKIIGKWRCEKPLKVGGVYTVSLALQNMMTKRRGLIIKNHAELLNTSEVAVYSDDGFMPLDLWVENSKAVDDLMKEIL